MENKEKTNFIRNIIDEHNRTGRFDGKVHTRFPPEPNGYLHIGHAKSICLNFGIAEDYDGLCNLRFDDTNPAKEEEEFVHSIQKDIKWLGYDWEDRLYFASDYFPQMYEFAKELIRSGKAYVDSQSPAEIRENRGTVKESGKPSPYRNRSAEENLNLLERMKNGEFEEGEHVLRAKIDMSSPNMLMRDPLMYRIKKKAHHRTENEWNIYPMYDFAHCLEDSLEGITHSLCSIEFENNRPLYDWFLENLNIHHPQQIEFARLNLNYTVMSKRLLSRLIAENIVSGWDDPRLPTISGLRRRGYTPESIRNFCEKIGLAKRESIVDMALLEHTIREDLNKRANRVMGVLRPLKVIIDNFPEEEVDDLEAINNPEDETAGKRTIPFTKEIYIERTDFMENPPKKFFRLAPGREVRLRYAYFMKCEKVIKDKITGEIKELHCTIDPPSRGGRSPDGRKVKATLHWVSARFAIDTEIRLYENLFEVPNPAAEEDITDSINPNSLKILKNCKLELCTKNLPVQTKVQFERLGYFCKDDDSTAEHPVFNRTVTLRDVWKKIQKRNKK